MLARPLRPSSRDMNDAPGAASRTANARPSTPLSTVTPLVERPFALVRHERDLAFVIGEEIVRQRPFLTNEEIAVLTAVVLVPFETSRIVFEQRRSDGHHARPEAR